MNLQKTLAKDWPALVVLALPFVLIGLFWNQIPEQVAMHWNIRGDVDRWEEKGFNILLLPVLNIGCYLLLLAVPYIDPKRRAESDQKGLRAFRIIAPFFLTGLFLVIFFHWIGVNFDSGKAFCLIMSLTFIAFGNYFQNIRPNYFIGIRTPWTLESEDIWRKTHRLGGKVWVVGGLIMFFSWLVFPRIISMVVFGATALITALIPVAYSFYLYVKHRQTAEPGH